MKINPSLSKPLASKLVKRSPAQEIVYLDMWPGMLRNQIGGLTSSGGDFGFSLVKERSEYRFE